MVKRIVSIFVTVAMAITLISAVGFNVSAAGAGTMVTFSDYDPGTTPNGTLPLGFSDVNCTNRIIYSAKTGVYGKTSVDKAFVVNPYWNQDKDPATQAYQARYNVNTKCANSDYIHFSTELAFDLIGANRWISFCVDYTDETGTEKIGQDTNRFISVNKTGNAVETTIGGEVFTGGIPFKTWIKLDVVMSCATGLADIYLDGELVRQNFDTGKKNITQVKQVLYGINQQKLDNGSFGASFTYIDNVLCEVLAEKPQIEKFSSYDTADFSGYASGIPDNFNLNIATDDLMEFKPANGLFGKAAEDKSLAIVAPKTNTETMKWEQVRYTNQKVKSNDYMYHKVSFKMAYTGEYMNRWIGLCGDACRWGSETVHPTVELKTNVNNVALIQLTKDTGSPSLKPILNVAGTKIEVDDTDISQGRWMKFDIVVDGNAKNLDVYLNGKKLNTTQIAFTYDSNYMNRPISGIHQIQFGVNHEYRSNQEVFPESRTYIDDLKINSYTAPPTVLPEEIPQPTGDITVFKYWWGERASKTEEINRYDVVINNADINAVPILAAYNEGRIENVVVGTKGDKKISIFLPNAHEGRTIKLFLFDSINGLMPVSKMKTLSGQQINDELSNEGALGTFTV